MPITVSIRTVQGTTASVDVEPTITIKELRETITTSCSLGFCTTLVFKGQPLRKDGATLEEINYQPGETLVGVFKKEAPKPAAETTAAPVQQQSTPAASTAVDPNLTTPVKSTPAPTTAAATTQPAAAAAQPPAQQIDPLLYQVDWSCPVCTYINIGARTLCEMCGSEDPNKAKFKKQPTTAAVERKPIDPARIEKRMKELKADEMDDATREAVRAMIEDDLRAEDENPNAMNDGEDDAPVIDLEDLLLRCESDPAQKQALCEEFGLPADASIDDLRTAITQQSHQQQMFSQEGLAQMLMQDPALAAQLGQILNENGGNPEALQQALLAMIQNGGLDGILGDEDDEDVEFDETMGDL